MNVGKLCDFMKEEKSANCIFRAQLMSLAFSKRPANQDTREGLAGLFYIAGADSSEVTVVRGAVWHE